MRGYGLSAGSYGGRGLAHGVIGSARVIAFGLSSVAPAGSVVGGLFILVSYAGFASPLVVVVAFVASLCCASTIAEFARRLPSSIVRAHARTSRQVAWEARNLRSTPQPA